MIISKGGGRPGMMPVGTYRAKIRVVPREGSNSIMIVFSGLDGEAENTECVDFINLDAAEWRIAIIYEAATGNRYPSAGESWQTEDIQGREVMVECEHRVNPNTDEKQARAAKIYPIS